MLDPRMAVEAQPVGAHVEARDCNGIAEHIVQPALLDWRRIDLQPALDQPLVMAFPRADHQAMLAECDRLTETVGGHMMDG
jgi:hypothetical protein